MPSYGFRLFSDKDKTTFEYGSDDKVTVLTFQGENDKDFPSINPNDHSRAQPGSVWSDEIKVTAPTLLAKTMRSLYSTVGSFSTHSCKTLIQDPHIFYHSIAEVIQSGILDYSELIASDLSQSQKLMICAHGNAKDTDNAYLETISGQFFISYQNLANYIAQHIDNNRKEPLIIDLSMCYAARSQNYKKNHAPDNISFADIESSFSQKFTKALAKCLPHILIQVKASATAVTFDYSSGIRMTELEEHYQDPRAWAEQHKGEDYFAPEILSFSHYADPVKGLYTKVTETNVDENQITHEFNNKGASSDSSDEINSPMQSPSM